MIWLIRTFIDYRRWLRLTRIQTDAHTKLLDRLTSNEDLMAYIQSSSGRRFLESAPIALDGGASRPVSAPVSRILLSLQAGVVLAAGGFGFLYASGRVIEDVAPRPLHHRRPGDCLWRRVLRLGYPGVWAFGASGAPLAAARPPHHRVMGS